MINGTLFIVICIVGGYLFLEGAMPRYVADFFFGVVASGVLYYWSKT